MKKIEKRINKRSEEIQTEMHNIIEQAINLTSKSKANYENYVIAFLINRIASLEIVIEDLQSELNLKDENL